MRLADKIPEWTEAARVCLVKYNSTPDQITTGRDAWTVAFKAGITTAAYAIGRDVTDGHIQTVLQRIFPNAVFKDRKTY